MYLLFYNISYTSYAFRIFNIPARTERRIKHTEAREDSRSPVKLQCSVRQRQGWAWTGGYSRLPGTLALRGQTLRPDRGGLRPRAPPPAALTPAAFGRSRAQPAWGARALLPNTSPCPQVHSLMHRAPGGSQHHSGCGWRGRMVPVHSGMVGGRRA